MKYIESETSGHLSKILLAMLQCQRHDMNYPINMAELQSEAQRLYKAGEGKWGTDEEIFTQIFTTRHHMKLRLYRNYINNMLELIYIPHLRKNFQEILKFY